MFAGFAGLLVLSVLANAIELPTGPNTPTNSLITLTGASLQGFTQVADASVPSRVLPTPAIMSTRINVRVNSKQHIPADIPAGEASWCLPATASRFFTRESAWHH